MKTLLSTLPVVLALVSFPVSALAPDLGPVPWLSTSFAGEGYGVPTVGVSCTLAGTFNSCFPDDAGVRYHYFPAGGPILIDNEYLRLSAHLATEVAGNAWTVALREPSLTLKRPFGVDAGELYSIEVYVSFQAIGRLAVPDGPQPVTQLVFGTDAISDEPWELLDAVGIGSELVDRRHSAVESFLTGDLISMKADFYQTLSLRWNGSTTEAFQYGSCTGSTTASELQPCVVTLEVWQPFKKKGPSPKPK